jgi:hypothetical protein
MAVRGIFKVSGLSRRLLSLRRALRAPPSACAAPPNDCLRD